MGAFGVLRSLILQAFLQAPCTHCSHARGTAFDPDSEENVGDIGRIALLFRTRNRISTIFALSDETSACGDGGRTHLNRGRQLSQVLIGSCSQLRLHIEQIRSLICRRVTLSPSMLLRILQRHRQRFPQRAFACKQWRPYIGHREGIRRTCEACSLSDTFAKFWCKHHTFHNGTLLRSPARSHCFLSWLKTIMVQGSTTIWRQVNMSCSFSGWNKRGPRGCPSE